MKLHEKIISTAYVRSRYRAVKIALYILLVTVAMAFTMSMAVGRATIAQNDVLDDEVYTGIGDEENAAQAVLEPHTIDYMELMIAAVLCGDVEAGQAAQAARDEKIDANGLEYVKISFDDLYYGSKLIQNEAGSSWLSDEWQRLVLSVALNRVASPEFGGTTLYEIITQPGQYAKGWETAIPSEGVVLNALYVLENGSLAPPDVIFQSKRIQGEIWKKLYDSKYGTTYLCYSNHRELYN